MEGLSGNLWPVHLKPYPDELLSSWLVRLAHGHGLKLHTFCAIVFGNDKNIWNRDIDKLAPDWLLKKVSLATGTSLEDATKTTLKSYEGILFETHQPCGNTKWINPLGIYHRIHKHPGLQFCPLCLASDKEPYFRKYWRLAFYTECEEHHILLHDRCPNCGEAINFHRVEMGIRSLTKPRSVVNCYKCDYSLKDASKKVIYCDDWQTTIRYRTLLLFHQMGWLYTEELNIHYSHHFFDVLRHLCIVMSSKQRTRCLLPYIANRLGFRRVETLHALSINFEKLNVAERHQLILCAIWLTLNWPRRFIEVCNELNLTSSYLLKDYENAAFWFYSVIDKHLSYCQYSPTLLEIHSARDYLIRNNQKAGIKKISRLLGCTTLKRSSF